MMIGEGQPFPAAYFTREIEELPPGADVAELRPKGQSGPGGLIFEVDPNVADSWIGFARPSVIRSSKAVSGLVTTPNPNQLCVIARGTAYLVDATNQGYCPVSASSPIMAVTSLQQVGLLLLATPWVVIGIGREGFAWQTGRLAIDGLRLDEADESRLIGVADPDSVEPREFVIDLQTGVHQGGAVVTL
jgi:hypothetical protein